jgi:hypothetical protein
MQPNDIGSIIREARKDMVLIWILRILAAALAVFLIWGWGDYRADAASGKHAKFLWWERNLPNGKSDTVYNVQLSKKDTIIRTDTVKITEYRNYPTKVPPKHDTVIIGKNINTGINTGHIGDVITERELEEPDKQLILQWISKVKQEKNVTSNCIVILLEQGSNAGKFTSELIEFLKGDGFTVSQGMAISYEQVKGLNFSAVNNCVNIHIGTL